MSLVASLEGKCCRCKQSQEGKYVFEDQNTQLIYCERHKITAPKKAELREIRMPTKKREQVFSNTLMSCSSSTPSDEDW